MGDALIIDALRTPIGKKKGSLRSVRADELGAIVLREVIRRNQIDPKNIDDVVAGCVTQLGEQGTNIARNLVLASDLPVSIPGTSVNRLCASSLQAVTFAAQAIMSGMADLIVAVGVESMNRVPMGGDFGTPHPNIMDRFAIVPQGISAELIAKKWKLSRSALDEFSLMSQSRALAAVTEGQFDREVIPVITPGDGDTAVELRRDETPRESNLEGLAKLKPAFQANGAITAGNSSQISDGAAAVLLCSPDMAERLRLKPRARFVTSTVTGVDPTIMLTGPIGASQKALARAQLKLDDIGVVEINEAFSSVALACAAELKLDWAKTNIRGGAIALGHPLGATGARLVTTALHLMEDKAERFGLITMCIGLGQGQTVILEKTT